MIFNPTIYDKCITEITMNSTAERGNVCVPELIKVLRL